MLSQQGNGGSLSGDAWGCGCVQQGQQGAVGLDKEPVCGQNTWQEGPVRSCWEGGCVHRQGLCPGLGGYPAEQAVGVRVLCNEGRGLGNGLGLIGKCDTGHVLLSMLEYRTCIAFVNCC